MLGKGSKERVALIREPAQKALRRYLETARHALAESRGEEALFLSRTGSGGLDLRRPAPASEVVSNLPWRAGYRRTRCAIRSPRICSRRRDPWSIQELPGHSSVSTTQVYTRVEPSRLRREYERAHPRA